MLHERAFAQAFVAEETIVNAAQRNKTHEVFVNLVQYHLGDAMDAGAYRIITDLVILDKRLNWFTFLPVLRNAGLLYKSEVRCCARACMFVCVCVCVCASIRAFL